MLKLTRVLIVAFAFVIMAGCVSRENVLLEAPKEKRVAVISVLGDGLDVYYRGATVFGNQFKSIDINALGVNRYVEKRFSVAIQDQYGISVIDTDADRVEMSKKYEDLDPSLRGLFMNPIDLRLENIKKEISDIAKKERLDAVIVIAPDSLYTGTTVEPEGVSLHSWGINNGVAGSYINIFANIIVVDPDTGRYVKYERFSRPDPNGWEKKPQDVYAMVSVKGRSLEDLAHREATEEDLDALGEILLDILDDALVRNTLKGILSEREYPQL